MSSKETRQHAKQANQSEQKATSHEESKQPGNDRKVADPVLDVLDRALGQQRLQMDQSKKFHQSALLSHSVVVGHIDSDDRLLRAQNEQRQGASGKEGRPFLQNHGASLALDFGDTPKEVKQWNTGIIDVHNTKQMSDRTTIDQGIAQMNALELQRAVAANAKKIIKQKKAALVQANAIQKSEEAELMFKQLQGFQELDEETKNYSSKIQRMKASGEMRDHQALERMEGELAKAAVVEKWAGTGLQDEIFNEYMGPTTKRQSIGERIGISMEANPESEWDLNLPETRELPPKNPRKPLFSKGSSIDHTKGGTYLSLDGQIHVEKAINLIEYIPALARQSPSLTQKFNNDHFKNKIRSLSRFFQLKQPPKYNQFSHPFASDKKQVGGLKILQQTGGQLNFVQAEVKQTPKPIKSQNLSIFGQKTEQMQQSIPLVKEWFQQLKVQDRLLCVSTIDSSIVEKLKNMQSQLQRVSKIEQGKFRMIQDINRQAAGVAGKDRKERTKLSFTMQLCNSQAHRSSPETAEAEQKLMSYLRITDTIVMHDTLTVKEELVSEPAKFYELAEQIVGQNYLRAPHEVIWLEESPHQCEFETCAPLWLNMHEPNSLASWVLYYLERAIFLQFQMSVHGQFLDCRDSNNQSIVLSSDSKNILMKEEIKPFWRTFCQSIQDHEESADELLAKIKLKTLTMFELSSEGEPSGEGETQGISSLHGGLETSAPSQPLHERIDKFLQKIDRCIQNNNSSRQPQLSLTELCMNTIKAAAQLKDSRDYKKIGSNFSLAITSSTTGGALSFQTDLAVHESNIEMILERIFVETFRDKITQDLKSNFTSTNKKVQRRKIKKLKEREQKLENERELERQIDQKEKEKNVIKVQNQQAVQLLVGSSEAVRELSSAVGADVEEKPTVQPSWSKEKTEAIKEKKNKKKNKKKQPFKEAEPKVPLEAQPEVKKDSKVQIEELKFDEVPLPKPSTPKQNKPVNQTQLSQSKVGAHNYFQVFGHKYAASLESQGLEQHSNISSEISGALTTNLGIDLHSGGAVTVQTKSTSVESKNTRQDQLQTAVSKDLVRQAEQANSIQEVVKIYKHLAPQSNGNQHINTTQWQRKQAGLEDMINELMSESSGGNRRQYQRLPDIIQVGVNQNELFAELDDIDSNKVSSSGKQSAGEGSSKSSVNQNKRIIKFTKRRNPKIIPRVAPSNSDQTSDPDSDIDLLPDLHTNFQPNDNDSSSAFEEEEDESLCEDDDSSIALSQSQDQTDGRVAVKKHKNLNRRSPGKKNRKLQSSASNKKSVRSADPKSVGLKHPINFYPATQEQAEAIIEPEKIIHAWKQLRENPPLTIQWIEKARELNTEWKESKHTKKNKKQRKLDWEARFGGQADSDIQPKQIEIIKPQPVPEPTPQSNSKDSHAQSSKDQPEKKPKTKKKETHVDAIEQFMHKVLKTGNESHEALVSKAKQDVPKQPLNADKQAQAKAKEAIRDAQKKPISQKTKETKESVPGSLKPLGAARDALPVGQVKPQKTLYAHKKSNINDQHKQERMSSLEEAKALSKGYEYKAKKRQPSSENTPDPNPEINDQRSPAKSLRAENTKESPGKPGAKPRKIFEEEKKQVVSNDRSAISPTKPDLTPPRSDLKIDSKEFKVAGPKQQNSSGLSHPAPPKNLAEALEGKSTLSENEVSEQKAEPKKKKKTKRSNKSRKTKNQAANPFILDPVIGQQLLLGVEQGQYGLGSLGDGSRGYNPLTNLLSGSQGGGPNFMNNPQVHDLLEKLGEQVLAQQQQQMAEYQQRQQQEAESQMLEDCEPCPEIDSERYDQFFDKLEEEMKNKIKEIDQLKDSVRKERQGFIQIMEDVVKETFQNKYGNGYVGIKIFGSMATELAIETSDVDLVVTGINQGQQHSGSSYSYRNEYQGKNQLLRMMQKLNDSLMVLKRENKIHKIKFIQTASVPIIKLVVDLQVINQQQINTTISKIKEERKEADDYLEEEELKNQSIDLRERGLDAKQIDPKVRYLQVDISIDEGSDHFQRFDTGFQTPRTHSGIDTIYHIQDLVRQRKDLRPIVMIIKKIFDGTFLSMPYYGGISSYSLVLMVSAYLKRFDSQKEQSLSTNLSGFFHFYGVGFKPHLFYLNGDQIEFCDDPQKRPFTDPFIVLDPLDPSNNISHSTFRIRDIQRALVQAFKIINLSCESYQETKSGILPSNEPRQVLERLVREISEQYSHSNPYSEDL